MTYQNPKEVIHTFYPDFIVKLNNNLIGIFEVKDKNDQDGPTVTKAKAEALNRYIFEHNNKNKSSLFWKKKKRKGSLFTDKII